MSNTLKSDQIFTHRKNTHHEDDWNSPEENGFPQRYTRILARTPDDISFYLYDNNSRLSDVVSVGISSWGNVNDTYVLNVGNDFESYYKLIDEGGLPINRCMKRDADKRHDTVLYCAQNTRVDKSLFQQRFNAPFMIASEKPLNDKKFALFVKTINSSLTERGSSTPIRLLHTHRRSVQAIYTTPHYAWP